MANIGRKLSLVLFVCLLCVASSVQGWSQTVTAGLTGTVTDQSGAVLVGAQITATNTATGEIFQTKANRDGIYNVEKLPLGTYTLAISAQGFQTTSFSQFTLIGGQVAKFDSKLSVGSETTVTVTTEQPLLNTQNSELSTTFSHDMITALPLINDNVMGLALYTPGVVIENPTQVLDAQGVTGNSFNANGGREQSNNFTLDGVDVSNASNNSLGYQINRDALQEFRIITGNGSAEYGNANGGQIVMVTRSGANQYHGSASFKLQNTLMNANSWVDKDTGPGAAPIARGSQNRDYYSGTIGGPIKKDKLFFFVDYKGVRQHISTGGFASVPDRAFGGNPAQDMTGNNGTAPAYDPYTGGYVTITNPAALYVLSHPAAFATVTSTKATSLLNNYAGYTGTKVLIDQGDAKIDYRLSDKDVISGRYSMVGRAFSTTTHVITPTTFPTQTNAPFLGFVVNWDHTFSSSITNEARLGFNRTGSTSFAIDVDGYYGTNGFKDFDVPNPQAIQTAAGIPQITFSGNTDSLAGFGSSTNNNLSRLNMFTYADDLTWQVGRHELKMGFVINRFQDNEYYAGGNAIGGFTFTGATIKGQASGCLYSTNPACTSTGGTWGDFLTDEASSYAAGSQGGTWGQRSWRPAIYFQDNFKMLPNLTLNLGLRWEYDSPYTEAHNKQANYDVNTGAIEVAGQNGVPSALYDSYYLGFMPRVGFAYSLDNNRLDIRGGYGINNQFEGLGAGVRLTKNPLFQFNASPAANQPGPYQMTNGFGTFTPGVIASAGTVTAWDKHIKPANVQQFDLLVGYQINNHSSIQAGYAGQSGHHLADVLALNESACSTIPLPGLTTPCEVPFLNNPNLPALGAGGFHYIQSEGVMNYNALQVTFNEHAWHDLEVIGNYSHGKAMADNNGLIGNGNVTGGGFNFPQDSLHLSADYGPAPYDVAHVASAALVYKLPIGRGKLIGTNWNHWLDTAIGGWVTGLTGYYHSGFAESILSGKEYYAPSGNNTNNFFRANKYREMKIVNHGKRSLTNPKAIAWFGTDPSAEGEASLVTTTTTCPNGKGTYAQITGLVGTTGIAGRTGSNNVQLQETAVCGTTANTASAIYNNPMNISQNPVASGPSGSFTENYTPNTPNGKPATGSPAVQTVYINNDNGVSAYGSGLSTGFGTAHVGDVRTPGYQNVDASVSKQFAIENGITLDFRADAFNVLNTVSLGGPQYNVDGTTFGQITTTLSAERHLQLSLKVNF